MKNNKASMQPFPNCPALDGCHCVTCSLAKIFHHANCPLSEEMLLGLGAGMGFIYWQMKMGAGSFIFVGGRGNPKGFFRDLAARTGVDIKEMRSGSAKKGEEALLKALRQEKPVFLGGDMGFLPWFDLPSGYHFGGHAFVACGFDGDQTVLASDMDPKASGVKKGFYAPITLEQLRLARNSTFKPFPPQNLWLECDFSNFKAPGKKEIYASIEQAIEAHLEPPIKNLGIRGMRHTASQLLEWPDMFGDTDLRMHLFNLYIFIEIGGTGGGCFRSMYARFLKEAAGLAHNPALARASADFHESARRFTEIALLFKDAENAKGLEERIQKASTTFGQIADLEEQAWLLLKKSI